MKWRIGRKVPINVYEGDRPVCQCHAAEDAALIVRAVNERYERLEVSDPLVTHLREDAPADARKKRPGAPEQLSHSEVEGAKMPRRSQK